jgi:alpha-L-fucosidase
VNWSTVSAAEVRPGTLTNIDGPTGKDGDADGTLWMPNEVDFRMRRQWFWSTTNEPTVKSLDELMTLYYRTVGYGASLLLNQTPDRTGLIPEPDVKRTAEFGAEIRRRFGKSLKETRGDGNSVELHFSAPQKVDHVITMEDLSYGQRVREYRIEGLAGKQWRELARGTSIGQKKIDPVSATDVTALRWVCTKSADPPKIRRLAAFCAGVQSSIGGAPPVYHVLKTWTTNDLPAEDTTWEFDLAPFCGDAGQYEVTLVATGGEGFGLRSVELLMGGVAAPESVKRTRGGGYGDILLLDIPGISTSLKLKVVLRRRQNATFGQVVLQRVR